MTTVISRAFRAETWRETAYLLLGGGMAVVGFVLLVAGISAGLSLLITLIGIPILVMTPVGARCRERARVILGRPIEARYLPPGPVAQGRSAVRPAATVARVARPRRNWIQEERRKTLGDWVAFCVACGHTLRYFEDFEGEVPVECPQCAGEVRTRCPVCGARIASAFAVECEGCGADVRPNELFGGAIRKPGR